MKETLYDILRPLADQHGPLPVKVILLSALSFLSVAFSLFLFILLSRLIHGALFAQKRWMEKKAQQVITSFLFREESWHRDRLIKFRRKYLSNSLCRDVFLNNLIELHKNIIGESAERLRLLYRELGFKKHTERKLLSFSWNTAARGINELAEMGTKEDARLLHAFINNKNPVLRSEAQIALLKLENDAPFSFLDDLQEPITEWQLIQLMQAAKNMDLDEMPDFSHWLDKKEESIIVFCIRLIAQFGQHQAGERLLYLLEHPHSSAGVRSEIIMAIRQLMFIDAAEKLRQLYPYETSAIQNEIAKTLAVISSGEGNLARDRSLPENQLVHTAPADSEKTKYILGQESGKFHHSTAEDESSYERVVKL